MKRKLWKEIMVAVLFVSTILSFTPIAHGKTTSVQQSIHSLKVEMKKAALSYVQPALRGELATSASLDPVLNNVKKNYQATRKVILTSNLSEKEKQEKLKEIEALYQEKIGKGLIPYIDAYNYATKYLDPLLKEIKEAEAKKDFLAVEKAYHKLSVQLKSRTSILYRVTGKAPRNLLLEKYKKPADQKRDELVVPVTIIMKLTSAQQLYLGGKKEEAVKVINDVPTLVAKLSSKQAFHQSLIKELERLQAIYSPVVVTPVYPAVTSEGGMLRLPTNLAILPDDSLVISDQGNHLIRRLSSGNLSTYAGMILTVDKDGYPLGGLHNDVKDKAIFSTPSGLVSDSKGNVYVADTANHVIRKITSEGQVITLAGNGRPGLMDGKSNAASFYFPQDLAVTTDGIVYVADTLNHVIRKIDTNGNVTTLNAPSLRPVEIADGVIESAGDYLDGTLSQAKFNEPSSLAIDEKGNLYVSDTGNQVIRHIDFLTNKVTTVAGNVSSSNGLYGESGFKDGDALASQFSIPKGIAITPEGGLLIADYGNHAIRYYYKGAVSTIVKDLQFPSDLAVTKQGTIFVTNSHTNQIIKITK
ncbi:MAG: hypothetical protein ABS939_05450 [Psychrobacillus sp.]